ncbi:MAG TPA: AAA family ATPase [Candidatus Dormibacteraeota bacterium]|nr:AAA family ATPase [Candidatus Dormibacteraeota bacterium]
MNLSIPVPSLVVLVGPSGAGKSTFAARHFRPTEVVSSDRCRALVSDRENNMAATQAAFRVLHAIAAERLRSGRLTVVDATNVRPESRKPLIALAREHGCRAVAIVFDLPEEVCRERNRVRPGRRVPDRVVQRQHEHLTLSIEALAAEGFHELFMLDSIEAVESVTIVRANLVVDKPARPSP